MIFSFKKLPGGEYLDFGQVEYVEKPIVCGDEVNSIILTLRSGRLVTFWHADAAFVIKQLEAMAAASVAVLDVTGYSTQVPPPPG